MSIFLVIAFLFYVGSLVGWGLELFYRRFFSKANPSRKWINPGFLIGPYLPLYGFCLCVLFLLAQIDVSFIQNPILQKVVLFVLMSICVTVLEYIAGLIFIKKMKVKLWDYSECKGNIQGIICPQFSFYWILLSAIYYFFVHPRILTSLYWLAENLSFSFFVGLFYGVFIIDTCYSLNVLNKIRQFAAEKQIVVRYETLRENIRKRNEELKEKRHFIFSLRSTTTTLAENLKQYFEHEQEKLKVELEEAKTKLKNFKH